MLVNKLWIDMELKKIIYSQKVSEINLGVYEYNHQAETRRAKKEWPMTNDTVHTSAGRKR